jgi:hypothetical protein
MKADNNKRRTRTKQKEKEYKERCTIISNYDTCQSYVGGAADRCIHFRKVDK